MNLTRCSRSVALSVFVVLLLASAGVAAAFSVSASGVPEESQVGSEVSVTYTIEDPFTDAPNQYTLRGATELENVAWTVTVMQAGTPIQDGETTYGNQTFQRELSLDSNGDSVRIELEGTTPAVENFTYAPEEQYLVASLARVTGSNVNEFRNDSAHHYTQDSRQARQAIESAESAIQTAGGNEEAEGLLRSAKSAYNAGNFDNAERLAANASQTAQSAQQSQQLFQTALLALGALVVLALVAGGIYRWQSGGDEYSKL